MSTQNICFVKKLEKYLYFLAGKKFLTINDHGKQCRPYSDFSFRSSLIWVCTVCIGQFVRHFGVRNFKNKMAHILITYFAIVSLIAFLTEAYLALASVSALSILPWAAIFCLISPVSSSCFLSCSENNS